MMTFWIFALAMSLVAAAFLFVPGYLLRRQQSLGNRKVTNVAIYDERAAEYDGLLAEGEIDQEEYNAFMIELKRTLLGDASEDAVTEDRQVGRMPLVFAILVPLFAIFAYADFGLSWGAITDVAIAESMQQSDARDENAMTENIEKLAERLKSQPDNHDGWYMLGRSYLNMGRYEESAAAFAHLLKTFTEDHSLSAFHAEALYMAENRSVTPRVAKAIDEALALNPHDITMLEIKALGAFQRQELRVAIGLFQRALAAGAEGERADMINRAIVRIQQDLGDAPMMEEVPEANAPVMSAPNTTATVKDSAAVAKRSLSVLVEVADSVTMPASTPVFVFARAVAGPPMPLAVQRMTLADLPKLITLDESMAMMQGMGLANFDSVQVVARISASGIANASPDDYQALSAPVDLTKETDVIKLKISQQVKDF